MADKDRTPSGSTTVQDGDNDMNLLLALKGIDGGMCRTHLLDVFISRAARLESLVLANLYDEACERQGSQDVSDKRFAEMKEEAIELLVPLARGDLERVLPTLRRARRQLEEQINANALLELTFG